MSRNNFIESGGFYFIHNFDSGNLGHVERVPTELITPSLNVKNNLQETPDYEFNLWTRPDCAGTEFENGNRSWFYFGIQASEPHALVRLNLINLNKQGKMYTQGMAPVTRTLPGKPHWERIRDRPVHSFDDNAFTLSFKYRTSENTKATTFFAFTYPFSFAELQIALNTIDSKLLPLQVPSTLDDIYYHRECLIYSLEGRRVDLLTISSYHGITKEKEERLKNMFPEKQERPFKFNPIKKIIFMSARVHPGETPSSFVFNGFLNLLLNRSDPIAIQLRRSFVFKLVPFLNPDGVARGHYRTDTRGVNLNRVYLNPSLALHPTVYAARALIRYYHFGCEKEDIIDDESVIGARSITSRSMADIGESVELITPKKKTPVKQVDSKKGKNTQTSKRPSSETVKKDKKNADESLSERVCDLKIQEIKSQTSDSAIVPPDPNRPSVLNPETLKSCLGSNVQLSTSEELNKQPSNPLRPLRDALKNSISLLMDSTSAATTSSIGGGNEAMISNIKVGFCLECRRALDKLEDATPGISATLPSYNAVVSVSPSRPMSRNSQQGGLFPPKYNSIHEYRTHQREMLVKCDADDKEQKDLPDNETYLCTNCFKRYKPGEEVEIELGSGPDTNTSTSGESRGDSGSVRGEGGAVPGAPPPTAAEGGDSHTDDTRTQGPTTVKTTDKVPNKSHHKMPSRRRPPLQVAAPTAKTPAIRDDESGLYLYIDLHGHASKKGIFMYGNHFEDLDSSVECMLLPRIMSLNNLHFHFSSCNFTERNMYLKDRRDGMSREGSGRVAVLKATGLVRSYTLECNYNTGRLVNVLPPPVKDPTSNPTVAPSGVPPKYTPHIYEEVGRSLGASILDLTGLHPNSRIPSSEHRNINSLREWLRQHTKGMKPQLTTSRLRQSSITSPNRTPLYSRPKAKIEERKENTYQTTKLDSERRYPPLYAPRSGHDIVPKIVKKESKPTRPRYMADTDKPKIQSKRRNILSIRKPNSKTQVSGIVKAKINRRFVDDSENPRHSVLDKMKRAFTRSARAAKRREGIGLTSSSSEDMLGGNWENVNGTALETQSGMNLGDAGNSGKRRSFPVNSPSRLKKIRLKAGM